MCYHKDINGKQYTIVCHAGDLQISHKDLVMVNKVIASLSVKYAKVGKMTVRRGKTHDYLGITLDFLDDGRFIVDMEEYLNRILSGLSEDTEGVATTSVADHLFKARAKAPKLNKERAMMFHLATEQIVCGTTWQTQPVDSYMIPDQPS